VLGTIRDSCAIHPLMFDDRMSDVDDRMSDAIEDLPNLIEDRQEERAFFACNFDQTLGLFDNQGYVHRSHPTQELA
jgi:hypothetical protein